MAASLGLRGVQHHQTMALLKTQMKLMAFQSPWLPHRMSEALYPEQQAGELMVTSTLAEAPEQLRMSPVGGCWLAAENTLAWRGAAVSLLLFSSTTALSRVR